MRTRIEPMVQILTILFVLWLVLFIHELGHYYAFLFWKENGTIKWYTFPLFMSVQPDRLFHTYDVPVQVTVALAGAVVNFIAAAVFSIFVPGLSFGKVLLLIPTVYLEMLKSLTQPLTFFRNTHSVVGMVKKPPASSLMEQIVYFNLGIGIFQTLPIAPLDGWKAIRPLFTPFLTQNTLTAVEITSTLLLVMFCVLVVGKDIINTSPKT